VDGGEISINGISISSKLALADNSTFLKRAHQLRQTIGMIFHALDLFPHKTLLENILLAPIVVKGKTCELSLKQGMKLLDKVGLTNFYDRRPWFCTG
jgi:polar amino acid transport system ATP-binding protein